MTTEEISDSIWGFDIGKGSLGEAVFKDGEFKHISSFLLEQDFGEIKTAASRRRQTRTRTAHKAREAWLEKCLREAGIEILKRRTVKLENGQWHLAEIGDKRLESEFPPDGENACYCSIALRCKLILGEKLEPWQIFKALNSAIQKRGYDEHCIWGNSNGTKSKDDEGDYALKLSQYSREKDAVLSGIENPEKYDFPCFFKAYKMGLWSPENPDEVKIRIDNLAQKAKGYVLPREDVEREFAALIDAAAKQYPKLQGKARYIMYGVTETPYASYFPKLRKEFSLKRSGEADWTALGQKVPRFDNRVVDNCKLICRLNACKIKPLKKILEQENKGDDLLYYQITTALKLLNLRFYRNCSIQALSFEEFKRAFELAEKSKYKISASALKKFLNSIAGEIIDENQNKIDAPKESGRAAFSRVAMRLLKELIFSGITPLKFYEQKAAQITNSDPTKGIVLQDLDFIKAMGDKIYIPDMETLQYAQNAVQNSALAINKLIGEQNDPIVRHRLFLFYDRIKSLQAKFGTPNKIVLEFVRDDFIGKEAKKRLSNAMRDRAKEKAIIAKDLDDNHYKGANMLLKMELFRKQNGMCVYTGEPLSPTELESLQIEHIVPRSRGGPNAQFNYVLTRENTNKEKDNRTPYEWLSADPVKWQSYTDRVKKLTHSLGAKRCKLLIADNAEELVEKYTALAETAHISKLAQKIACLHFGFPFGSLTGKKRVFTVSGSTTAQIRWQYKLNQLLHNQDVDMSKLSYTESLKLIAELENKNRKNKKHHALDAMCLCFAPSDPKKARLDKLIPKEICERSEVALYFKKYLDALVPANIAPKKPSLEDGIYSLKKTGTGEFISRKYNLEEIAYKNVGPSKKAYDLESLAKSAEKILSEQIKKLVKDFAKTNPNENDWKNWCYNLKLTGKNGKGTRVLRVAMYVGNKTEFKDLSKDGSGAYRKGDLNKGQIVWLGKDGKYKVSPIYVHSSKAKVLQELKNNQNVEKIAGIFNSQCLVEINDVFNAKGELLLKAGVYMLNTINAIGNTVVTDANGNKSKQINIAYFMKANMRRVNPKDL